jgi:hypothetical protein
VELLGAPRRAVGTRSRGGLASFAVVTIAAMCLSGCGIVKTIEHKALNDLTGHNKTLNAFTSKINTNPNASYEATYVTTGSSPATITIATSPPKDFLFEGGGSTGRLLQNSTGSYACTETTSGGWSCTRLSAATFNTQKAVYALYSGSYWIDFLKIYSTVAGLAGVSIKASSMTVNGFPLSCIVVNAKTNSTGTSTWCETSTGVLAYVQATSNGTAFELKSYSTSPAASLFSLPAGATVNTLPPTPTVPTSSAA